MSLRKRLVEQEKSNLDQAKRKLRGLRQIPKDYPDKAGLRRAIDEALDAIDGHEHNIRALGNDR